MLEIKCIICGALLRTTLSPELAKYFKFRRFRCPRHVEKGN